ncbi:MAG: universal stress protein [Saprospiraceae bacterium]
MTLFSRALLALDMSETDHSLIHYFAYLQPLINTKQVYFVHIMPDFVAPKGEAAAFQKLFNPEHPIDEKMRAAIFEQIQTLFADRKNLDLAVEVIEGKPYEKLLHWTKVKDIDLLVTGIKKASEGSGITPRRVARHSECNILFVPTEAPTDIRNILVLTDFSENSLRALRTAIELRQQIEHAKITVLHVVDLPSDSYYLRTPPERGFTALLRDAAQESFNKLMIENQINKENLSFDIVENHYLNIAAHIIEYADTNPTDLLILGAQGHSAFENFLYGSVTERLVEKYRNKPILIIR